MNTDAAILLTIADQRARITALEQENAELRAALEAGPHLTPRPTAMRDPA